MSAYEENLADGLILRAVRDEQDVERYAAFNAAVFDAASGITSAHLLHHHPEIGYDDFLLVEDEHTDEVVSTVCLIPWHCRYEDIVLDVAMLEMVATHPQYRHRGLIRAQVNRLHQMVTERRFDLSIIEGIPYYYRQYGYTYAIDHRASDSLPVWRIPNWCNGEACPYRMRQATPADAPVLTRFYQESMAAVQFHALRSLEYWRFLLQSAKYPTRVVEDRRNGCAVGYVCTTKLANRGIRVAENWITNHDAGMAVLQQLKAESSGEIQLGWPQTSTLVQNGRSLGSVSLPVYQWLLHIPDVVRLLSKIGSVLERRVAASVFAGLTADVCINLFREAFVLRFEKGRLLGVESAGFVDASMGAEGGDICIPPEAFVRLLFGYRSLDEMRDAWPDIVVKPERRHLVDVLFPKMTSYLCMPYMYCGPVTGSTAQS